MHEFSVANQAVEKIMDTASFKKAKRILNIEILMGELSMLGKEQFLFWIKEMLSSKGEITRGIKIECKPVRAKIECGSCGYEGGLKVKDSDHFNPVFVCPSCNKSDIEVKEGRDCVLKRIQLEL